MPPSNPQVEEGLWPWPEIAIARVLVKLKNRPAPPGNYFYAVKHKPDEDPDIDTERYLPASAVTGLVEALERLAEQFSRNAQASEIVDGPMESAETWHRAAREVRAALARYRSMTASNEGEKNDDD